MGPGEGQTRSQRRDGARALTMEAVLVLRRRVKEAHASSCAAEGGSEGAKRKSLRGCPEDASPCRRLCPPPPLAALRPPLSSCSARNVVKAEQAGI